MNGQTREERVRAVREYYNLPEELNPLALPANVNLGLIDTISDAFWVGFAETSGKLRGITTYAPFILKPDQMKLFRKFGQPVLEKTEQIINSIASPEMRERVAQKGQGKLAPKTVQDLGEVVNTWATHAAENLPRMIQNRLARTVGKAVGAMAGPVGAAYMDIMVGIGDTSLNEAGNFAERAESLGIHPAVADLYAAQYGILAGAVEYVQLRYMSKPFQNLFGNAEGVVKARMQTEVLRKLSPKLIPLLKSALGITGGGFQEMLQEGMEVWFLNKAGQTQEKIDPNYQHIPLTYKDVTRAGILGAGVAAITKGAVSIRGLKPGLTVKPTTYLNIVRQEGGLKAVGDLADEVKRLPASIRRNKTGLTLDQMTERLQQRGLPVTDVNDLIEKLYSGAEVGMPETAKDVKEMERREKGEIQPIEGREGIGLFGREEAGTEELFAEQQPPTKLPPTPPVSPITPISPEPSRRPVSTKLPITDITKQKSISFLLKLADKFPNLSEKEVIQKAFSIQDAAAQEGYQLGRKELRTVMAEATESKKLIGGLQKLQKLAPKMPNTMEPFRSRIIEQLDNYDFHNMTDKKQAQLQSRLDYVDRLRESGELVPIPDKYMEELDRLDKTSLRDMTLEDLRQLHGDMLSNLQLAKNKNKFIGIKEKRDTNTVIELLRTISESNVPARFGKAVAKDTDYRTPPERGIKGFIQGQIAKAKNTYDKFLGMPAHKIEFLLEVHDNFKPDGLWQTIMREPIAEGENLTAEMQLQYTTAVQNAVNKTGIKLDQEYKLPTKPVNGIYLNGLQKIAVYLNSFNPYNLRRLTSPTGHSWSLYDIDSIKKSMTPQQVAFAKELFKIASMYEQPFFDTATKFGLNLKPEPFYWHIDDDPDAVQERMIEAKGKQDLEELFAGAVNRRLRIYPSATKKRVGGVNPLNLDPMAVLNRAMEDEIRFIAYAPPIRDIKKLIYDPRIRQEIARVHGPNAFRELQSWLVNMANPKADLRYDDPINQVAGSLKRHMTLASIGFKVAVALQNLGAYGQSVESMRVFGPRGTYYAGKGIADFVRNPAKAVDFIKRSSTYMKLVRGRSLDREMYDYTTGMYKKNINLAKFAFAAFKTVDMFTSYPTWLGAYQQGINELYQGNHELSVKYADKTVRETQGSGHPADLPGVQRGPELKRLFTMFYSHFSGTYNMMARTNKRLQVGDISLADAVVAYWWLLLVPGAFNFLLMRPGKIREPKELLKGIVSYGFSAIPYIGPIANATLYREFDYRLSPATAFIEEGITAVAAKSWPSRGKHAAKSLGYLFGIPTPQMLITGSGIADLMKGETKNPARLIFSKWSMEGLEDWLFSMQPAETREQRIQKVKQYYKLSTQKVLAPPDTTKTLSRQERIKRAKKYYGIK